MAQAQARPLPRPPTVPLPNARLKRWRLYLVLLALIAAHVAGWQLTKINIPALITGLPNMRHIVGALLTPDAFERIVDRYSAEGDLTIAPETATPPAAAISPATAGQGGATLRITPAAVTPDAVVNLQGSGWPAGRTGRVLLSQSGGIERPAAEFTVAPDGTVNYAFYAPASLQGTIHVRAVVDVPRFGWRPTDTLRLCLRLIVETLFLALMGTSLAIVFTLPLSFLGARNIMGRSRLGRAAYYATRTLFNLLRSVEVVIVVTIMAVVVGIGSFAGVLAIVIHSIGALGKLYSEAIENIDPGPIEAISATGARPLQVIRYGVVPQVLPEFLSFTLYRFDINVRMSTIVGLVGGGGIGFILTQYINLLRWNQAGTAIWLIAIVVTAIDYLSAYLREKII